MQRPILPNDLVTIRIGNSTVLAHVDKRHADGTATVTATFLLRENGEPVPDYLGTSVMLPVASLTLVEDRPDE